MTDLIKSAFQIVERELPVIIDFNDVLREAMDKQQDMQEIFEYYRSVSLENEVKPLIEYLNGMNKDVPQFHDNYPLNKIPFFIGDWDAGPVESHKEDKFESQRMSELTRLLVRSHDEKQRQRVRDFLFKKHDVKISSGSKDDDRTT
jgi:hypothetical protein